MSIDKTLEKHLNEKRGDAEDIQVRKSQFIIMMQSIRDFNDEIDLYLGGNRDVSKENKATASKIKKDLNKWSKDLSNNADEVGK